ncbi:MAG TPA: tetratricopeptide repeat protein [Burkholderiales bacterium]|nr:tetratricopeptide repeat protein [Burkholderiales bacterium]
MKRALATAVLLLATCLALPVAHADGDASPAPAGVQANPDAEAGKAAIRAQNWKGAIDSFTKVAASNAGDADAQNWLGYAYRKLGNLDVAFKHYNEALRLDPRHRGAHEYIGEAYLMKGDLTKAKEHLAVLDRICFFGCEEYSDLKKAIAEYENRKK